MPQHEAAKLAYEGVSWPHLITKKERGTAELANKLSEGSGKGDRLKAKVPADGIDS